MKLLVDECLSPQLARRAREVGFGESSHVVWMNKAGWKDWELKEFILAEDWTFVTINSVDFRGPLLKPGSSGQYAGVELHAGLICFNAPDGVGRDEQLEMLDAALQIVEEQGGEIINKLIEVILTEEGIDAQIFSLPAAESE